MVALFLWPMLAQTVLIHKKARAAHRVNDNLADATTLCIAVDKNNLEMEKIILETDW